MPTLAATGCPQLGQVPVWTWGSVPASALGLKHMINLRSFRRTHAPGHPQPTLRQPFTIASAECTAFMLLPLVAALAAPRLASARAIHSARVSAIGTAIVLTLAASGDALQLFIGELITLSLRLFEYLLGGHPLVVILHDRTSLSSRHLPQANPRFACLFTYTQEKPVSFQLISRNQSRLQIKHHAVNPNDGRRRETRLAERPKSRHAPLRHVIHFAIDRPGQAISLQDS